MPHGLDPVVHAVRDIDAAAAIHLRYGSSSARRRLRRNPDIRDR
jgi:hypothetical protein